ncbi:CPBP family intramembrane glutamic endopeptidase [Natronococcus occultus]|uniref:Putative metal-dependent membrane protease n=1 Tax=Natronococcus occultus SP4 TaxID=694430 RepID=L0K199_9EURY|nr:type II CAAX endopeptidase family protein [Natronococcus occultus]AGB38300.1 putative metal-dependent membrane protease [Natronococcus occultus SP4]
MSSEYDKSIESIEEWKVATMSMALLAAMFVILVGSHIVANSYLSIPWLLSEAEGAVIGIPAALVIYLLASRAVGIPHEAIFVTIPGRSILRWVGFGAVLVGFVVVSAVGMLPGALSIDVGEPHVLLTVLLSAVLLGLLAAITEELVFRGYLLSFVGHHWGWKEAIVLTSVLFGLLHNGKVADVGASELYVLVATAAGLLYALVTYYTKNIWNAVALHAIWNTAFHTRVVSIESAERQPDEAIVDYQYTESPFLFGGDLAAVTASPFVLVVLIVASVAVLVGYEGKFLH